MCDTCGFVYPHRIMRFNTIGMLVSPTDFEVQFDLKNHPQNKIPDVRDNPAIRDPRPDNGGRNLTWGQATTNWEDTDKYWNLI